MKRLLVLAACLLGTASCGDGRATTEPAGSDDDRAAQKALDGSWYWQENGKALYKLQIENGRISAIEQVARNGKTRKMCYAKSSCSVEAQDLTLVWFGTDDTRWRIKFDFDPAAGRDRVAGNADQIPAILDVQSQVSLQDDLPRPPLRESRGMLVRG